MKKNTAVVSLISILLLAGSSLSFATPKASDQEAAAASNDLSGTVTETMNAGGYTYINVKKKAGGQVWVAIPETSVAKGSKVSFRGGMEMRNFQSKALNKTFDVIFFADGIAAPAAEAKPAAARKAADPKKDAQEKQESASPGSKGAASGKDAKISVAKASGANAYTVAEAFAKSAALNKKTVVIRGKVVKVSSGIMGKNWIHLQDGTGSEAKKNHNLVCTTTATAEVGDVVTMTGILAKDKDFGGGYKYSAIVEDATLKKQ